MVQFRPIANCRATRLLTPQSLSHKPRKRILHSHEPLVGRPLFPRDPSVAHRETETESSSLAFFQNARSSTTV